MPVYRVVDTTYMTPYGKTPKQEMPTWQRGEKRLSPSTIIPFQTDHTKAAPLIRSKREHYLILIESAS